MKYNETKLIGSVLKTNDWISKSKTKEDFLRNFKLYEFKNLSKLGESTLQAHFVVCIQRWNKPEIKFTVEDYNLMKTL